MSGQSRFRVRQAGRHDVHESIDPVLQMEDLQDRMGQLMNGLFALGPPTVAARMPMAPVDIEETDDAYVVEVDLPGVTPEDLYAEARESCGLPGGSGRGNARATCVSSCARREFEQVIALPGEVDPNRVEALRSRWTGGAVRVLMLGAPGSGKGTHGPRIAERYAIPYVSTGEMLRRHIGDRTPLGQAAKPYVDQGDLVPDDLMLSVVLGELIGPSSQPGYVLDGFPRTLPQAIAADEATAEAGGAADAVVFWTSHTRS